MENVGIGGIIVYLGIIVLQIAAMWKIFEKAGEPGWAAIVPIYNLIVMYKIAGKPIWWILLLLVPIANLVTLIMVVHAISTRFGKDTGFTVGLIFLGFIFYPILGFGDAQYQGVNPNANLEGVLDA